MTIENNELHPLKNSHVEHAIKSYFKDLEPLILKIGGNTIHYYQNGSSIIIATPLAANNKITAPTYKAVEQALKQAIPNLDAYYLVAPIIGQGVSEPHIVTLYRQPTEIHEDVLLSEGDYIYSDYILFDSKISDPVAFLTAPNTFAGRQRFSLFNAIKGIVNALLDSGLPKNIQVTNDTTCQGLKNVTYQALGTQSFFDPITCGYRTIDLIIQLAEQFQKKGTLDLKAERSKLCKTLTPAHHYHISYSSFLKKAWQETYPETGFWGWPSNKGISSKMSYFLFLGFIFKPLQSFIKLPTEFALKWSAETANYVKNKLYAAKPTSRTGQYARSFFLLGAHITYGLLESARVITRVWTSPINSFKAGWKKNKALGLLSAACSFAGYAALIAVTAPFAGIIAAKFGIGTVFSQLASTPILSFAGQGISWVAGKVGLTIAPVITEVVGASMVAVASASFFSKLGQKLVEKIEGLRRKPSQLVSQESIKQESNPYLQTVHGAETQPKSDTQSVENFDDNDPEIIINSSSTDKQVVHGTQSKEECDNQSDTQSVENFDDNDENNDLDIIIDPFSRKKKMNEEEFDSNEEVLDSTCQTLTVLSASSLPTSSNSKSQPIPIPKPRKSSASSSISSTATLYFDTYSPSPGHVEHISLKPGNGSE